MAGPAARLLEATLNRGLRESASARAACAALAGRRLAITVEPPGLALCLEAGTHGVTVGDDTTGADAALAGGPLGFARLLTGDPEEALRSGAVHIDGDTAIAERFRTLLALARPDAEEVLARLVGDVAAHQLAGAARETAAWAGRTGESLARSLTEYLQEERRDVPTRPEVDAFCADVDRLANDVDRAEARLARLAAGRED